MPENQLTTEEKRAQLLEFVPDDTAVAPMQFIGLVADQILGRDKQGQYRPAADLKLFLYQCKRTGLDPLARQIYAVYRTSKVGDQWVDKMTIQTSIDGFRLVAERTGKYAGQDAIKYEYDKDGILTTATCTVYKINSATATPFPTSASADWDEYKQTNRDGKLMGLWDKMPKVMLGKVAEALALRKAFPQEMSGLYTAEEMGQSGNTPKVEAIAVQTDLPQPTNEKPTTSAVQRREAAQPPVERESEESRSTGETDESAGDGMEDMEFTVQKVVEKKTKSKDPKPFKSVLTEHGWMTAWQNTAVDIEEGVTYFAAVEREGNFMTIVKIHDARPVAGSVNPDDEINVDDIEI